MHYGSFHYKVAGRPITLTPVDNVIAIRFREPALYSIRQRVAESAALGPFATRFEIPGEKFTVFKLLESERGKGRGVEKAGARLEQYSEVARATPVFKMGSKRVLTTDRIILKLHGQQPELIDDLKTAGFEVVEGLENQFVLRLPNNADPLEVSRSLAENDKVAYAEPDFVTVGTRPVTDTVSPRAASSAADEQYAMRIIQADRAWLVRQGDPAIKVAILDDGVDDRHEDLREAIQAAYDATSDTPLGEINSWDGHGTACAGLAAASHRNELGVRGVGAGCSLLVVRIALSAYPGGPWATTSSNIRRGIDWAVDAGAAVLSNSWGGAPSNAVLEAIQRARAVGREGKGCIVVVAAGNDGGPVDFPGNVDGVLTVSGTNEFDEFKTVTSRDGETWWASNFGANVGIAAPAVHIRSTDITGAGGLDAGNYYPSFNGTSAAAPLVAGAAALILSADNSLTESDVRRIIQETADKIGDEPYLNNRNDKFGFGRLNVRRAIEIVINAGGIGVEPAQILRGMIKQAGSGEPRAACFYLDQNGEASYELKTFDETDLLRGAQLLELERENVDVLVRFLSTPVKVTYSELQDTPNGAILWGARIQADGDGSNGSETPDGSANGRGPEVPPSEVRLVDPSEDLFR